ncbi:polysaccharide biosynthesis protein [Paenibacillus sp. IB182496]|uniref:Polysaccharide biosynthesis protein n=1 Tax=Paenibacillus sabuli TaxID=2772509 RepID=A0A927GTG8_9BACL|nr:nucleoside-diphosphate sugar epimerase/dehydratase [Paenibacillus sabuli]MBD2847563.1 polysaccharide biosynthesis protein [Paenibacillus sabuli]
MGTKSKLLGLFILDIAIIWFSIGTSYWLRYGEATFRSELQPFLVYSAVSMVLCGAAMIYYRLYHRMWQYASISEMLAIAKAVGIGWLGSYFVASVLLGVSVPLGIAVRTLETTLLLSGGIRFLWRLVRMHTRGRANAKKSPVLIIGAGDCGALIAKELLSPSFANWRLVGFVDDDPAKQRMQVYGLPVVGDRTALSALVAKHAVEELIIAMPSAPKKAISELIELGLSTGAKVKMIPALSDLISGKVSVKAIRDVSVEDLLGRDPVQTDMAGIASYVAGKTVLVTGAGGSIGSELCRQIGAFRPDRLLLLGHGENSIYTIEMELRSRFAWLELETIIADIQDRERIDTVFRQHRPEVVFHAAAHKHVPLMERNPGEAVKNNVLGTKNVADGADKYGAERFVMISSDKAVNPTSLMGATKRIAEMYVQGLSQMSGTKFVAVRFGNVLGSRGSVIPMFKQQIARGGPVTVTHPEMVRYFMTIPEAVQLVIQAGSLARGGEIFVLDMGEPVNILKLAEDLIRLSGYDPYLDIPIHFTGIREGEKLYEELLTRDEAVSSTQHERIYIGRLERIDHDALDLELARLKLILPEGEERVRAAVAAIVPLMEQVEPVMAAAPETAAKGAAKVADAGKQRAGLTRRDVGVS